MDLEKKEKIKERCKAMANIWKRVMLEHPEMVIAAPDIMFMDMQKTFKDYWETLPPEKKLKLLNRLNEVKNDLVNDNF